MGFFSNSLGLISDAGHNLGDVFSLLLAMIMLVTLIVPVGVYADEEETADVGGASEGGGLVAVGYEDDIGEGDGLAVAFVEEHALHGSLGKDGRR